MDAVDVVMLTKNSKRILAPCLESIYENVPVNRLVVVDAFSTDGTLPTLNEFNRRYGNVKILSDEGSRGRAREIGIGEVETDWFMFVDSDVILCKDWFKMAAAHIQDDVGAVWGVDVPGNVENPLLTGVLKRMEGRVFNIRGGCHDILIRHKAVEGISIPSQLHVLEDAYIKEWITARGYKVVVSYDAYCRHYKEVGSLASKDNRLSTVFELKNMRLVKERLIYAGVFAFIWLIQEIENKRNPSRSLKR
ncbi:glycosyltransferase family 2 protein [Candidatus Bathyarchaeota archaeon]|nr:glycosyltransferase family 2 protein [Candidatus Bathyarchaeota archaeon]